ncbi:MAG: hypothetical protein ABH803_00300 [Candidatus Micrarchaeota archaeon]
MNEINSAIKHLETMIKRTDSSAPTIKILGSHVQPLLTLWRKIKSKYVKTRPMQFDEKDNPELMIINGVINRNLAISLVTEYRKIKK